VLQATCSISAFRDAIWPDPPGSIPRIPPALLTQGGGVCSTGHMDKSDSAILRVSAGGLVPLRRQVKVSTSHGDPRGASCRRKKDGLPSYGSNCRASNYDAISASARREDNLVFRRTPAKGASNPSTQQKDGFLKPASCSRPRAHYTPGRFARLIMSRVWSKRLQQGREIRSWYLIRDLLRSGA